MANDKSKIALASMILGILSLFFLFVVIPLIVRINLLTDLSGVGMILGVFSGVWGMILGLWGLLECTIKKRKGLAFAIVGLVTSIISIAIFAFLTVAIATFN